MTKNQATDICKILEQSKGDDLYRAEHSFRYYSPNELEQEYAESGKTCRAILDEYRAYNAKIDALIEAIKKASEQ